MMELYRLTIIMLIVYSVSSFKRVCYYTNWSQSRPAGGRFTPDDIDPYLCTHIIFAYARIVADEIQPTEWNDEDTQHLTGQYEKVTSLKNINPKLKVLLGITGWNTVSQMGSWPNSKPFRTNFIDSTITYLRQRNFDGIDLNWAGPTARRHRPLKRNIFTDLLQELRNGFEAEANFTGYTPLLLTAAVSGERIAIENRYDIPKLSRLLDFLNVMSFDLQGSWQSTLEHHSPLYPRGGQVGDERYKNVGEAMSHWVNFGAPNSKLLLGIPFYGRTFRALSADKTNMGNPDSGVGPASHYTMENGFMSYYEVCNFRNRGATKRWHDEHQVPYLINGTTWVAYDDKQSIAEKTKWTKTNHFGGVVIWALDLDDFNGEFCNEGRYPLMQTIFETLNIKRESSKDKTKRNMETMSNTNTEFGQQMAETMQVSIKQSKIRHNAELDISYKTSEGLKSSSVPISTNEQLDVMNAGFNSKKSTYIGATETKVKPPYDTAASTVDVYKTHEQASPVGDVAAIKTIATRGDGSQKSKHKPSTAHQQRDALNQFALPNYIGASKAKVEPLYDTAASTLDVPKTHGLASKDDVVAAIKPITISGDGSHQSKHKSHTAYQERDALNQLGSPNNIVVSDTKVKPLYDTASPVDEVAAIKTIATSGDGSQQLKQKLHTDIAASELDVPKTNEQASPVNDYQYDEVVAIKTIAASGDGSQQSNYQPATDSKSTYNQNRDVLNQFPSPNNMNSLSDPSIFEPASIRKLKQKVFEGPHSAIPLVPGGELTKNRTSSTANRNLPLGTVSNYTEASNPSLGADNYVEASNPPVGTDNINAKAKKAKSALERVIILPFNAITEAINGESPSTSTKTGQLLQPTLKVTTNNENSSKLKINTGIDLSKTETHIYDISPSIRDAVPKTMTVNERKSYADKVKKVRQQSHTPTTTPASEGTTGNNNINRVDGYKISGAQASKEISKANTENSYIDTHMSNQHSSTGAQFSSVMKQSGLGNIINFDEKYKSTGAQTNKQTSNNNTDKSYTDTPMSNQRSSTDSKISSVMKQSGSANNINQVDEYKSIGAQANKQISNTNTERSYIDAPMSNQRSSTNARMSSVMNKSGLGKPKVLTTVPDANSNARTSSNMNLKSGADSIKSLSTTKASITNSLLPVRRGIDKPKRKRQRFSIERQVPKRKVLDGFLSRNGNEDNMLATNEFGVPFSQLCKYHWYVLCFDHIDKVYMHGKDWKEVRGVYVKPENYTTTPDPNEIVVQHSDHI